MNLPLYKRAYSWLRNMALAEPKFKTQSGFGEKRVTICLYLPAFGNVGRRFSSSTFSFLRASDHFSSTIRFCSSTERLLTSSTTLPIKPESSFARSEERRVGKECR